MNSYTTDTPLFTTGKHADIVVRTPGVSEPIDKEYLRRFTLAFYEKVILPQSARTGELSKTIEKIIDLSAKTHKPICRRTFDTYVKELLDSGWISYRVDYHHVWHITPLYCPPSKSKPASERAIAAIDPSGFIYMMKSGNDYKIGRAKDLLRRLTSYKTHNADGAECIASYWATDSVEDEKHWHAKFAPYHLRGEWFRLFPEHVEAFTKFCAMKGAK